MSRTTVGTMSSKGIRLRLVRRERGGGGAEGVPLVVGGGAVVVEVMGVPFEPGVRRPAGCAGRRT